MKSVALGTMLALASLLTAATPVNADSTGPTVDATCVRTAHGTYATPVDPQGTNAPQSDTLKLTGTVKCVDSAGAPVATGSVDQTVTMPRTECTGDDHRDTATTRVKWSDGTVSTFAFNHIDVVKADGTASLVTTGSVTRDSARFAGDTLNAVGTSVDVGCGTATGETSVDSTLVIRLTH